MHRPRDRRDFVAAGDFREIDVPNADRNAPPPEMIWGGRDSWAEVQRIVQEHGIKPRKGAVMALELMMTTSPEWWSDEPAEKADQRKSFGTLCFGYLAERFGVERIANMVWHLDEQTWHIHAIVVPAKLEVDGRRKDGTPVWTLDVRGHQPRKGEEAGLSRQGIGNRKAMMFEQTKFAEAMAPLGLVRGKELSMTRHVPNAENRSTMEDAIKEAEAAKAIAEAQAAAAGREREDLARGRGVLADRLAALQ